MCVPTPSAEVVKEAVPVESSVAVPRLIEPSVKLMAPVGVPVPGATAVTVEVNVTA